MTGTKVAATCSSCGARIARDHDAAVCSPCRRRQIETRARGGRAIARNRVHTKAQFDHLGLIGLADDLGCTTGQALDALINAQLLPAMTPRREALLHGLVALGDISHVAAAEALGISRWTVATYRGQLGLDKFDRSPAGPQSRTTEPVTEMVTG